MRSKPAVAAAIALALALLAERGQADDQSPDVPPSRASLDDVLAAGALQAAPYSCATQARRCGREIRGLSWMMYMENGRLGFVGPAAVGTVIMNRTSAPPRAYSGPGLINVLLRDEAFSPALGAGAQEMLDWVNDGVAPAGMKPHLERLEPLAEALLDGWRFSPVADQVYHFLTPAAAERVRWDDGAEVVYAEVGGHLYLRDVDKLHVAAP